MKDNRMSKARFVQEYVISSEYEYDLTHEERKEAVRHNIDRAEIAWDFLTEAGYGDEEKDLGCLTPKFDHDNSTGKVQMVGETISATKSDGTVVSQTKGFVDGEVSPDGYYRHSCGCVKGIEQCVSISHGYEGDASAKRLREDTLRKTGGSDV